MSKEWGTMSEEWEWVPCINDGRFYGGLDQCMSRVAGIRKSSLQHNTRMLARSSLINSIRRNRSRIMSVPSEYETWSREALIAKLVAFESTNTTIPQLEPRPSTVTPECLEPKRKSAKEPRAFDMSKYSQRHVAFKVAYFGWSYSGFAAQGNEREVPTVEGRIFEALMAAKLIEDPAACNFSRCGRTDKGVSGLGQVIALDVRSNLPKEGEEGEHVDEGSSNTIMEGVESESTPPLAVTATFLPADTTTTTSATTLAKPKTAKKPRVLTELPYIETLNRLLPDDIRIIAWAPVPPTFNARFDCRSRTYRYFFLRGPLDITLMQQAAHDFLGPHDFRNFCKLDPSKDITNYERNVLSLDIRPVHGIDASALGPEMDLYEVELRGTAFLWHQVRCMMAILFLVGQQLEPPGIVRDLLDLQRNPAKPEYTMASELPLVLYDCEFEGVPWRHSHQEDSPETAPQRSRAGAEVVTPVRLYKHVFERWYEHMTKAYVMSSFMGAMTGLPVPIGDGRVITLDECQREGHRGPKAPAVDVVQGGGRETRVSRYVRLADRQKCDSDEVKKEKYRAKRARVER
ncbi:pseudouridine synthase [Jimgerdemannia flammicorona]|uniref:Pseudouridine synthase n=1 Tax=Jimgerdemannia flammicorona TaxID=994334 RepID=A0A433DLY2_9FUNG|nr:pseudouridine synthase [Jimgerdemannia flammicorona]